MTTIQTLRERASARANEVRALVEKNNENWTTDHQAQYDAGTAEILALREQIDRMQKADELLVTGKENDQFLNSVARMAPGGQAGDRMIGLYDKWLRGGDESISAAEWTDIRNTMSTTTTTEGGFTVPSEISSQLVDSMKHFGTMRQLAASIRTSDGRPLSFPTSDGTSEVGEVIGQNTTATGADPSFNTVTLNVFKYSSKIVAVPFELLQDTNINMEAFIRERLAQRLGRIANQHFTTGGGTTVPDGVMARASTGKTGTTGQTTTVIYDDIVDLIHSVDPAYRQGGRSVFMTSDAILRVLRKLKDTANMPIWLPNREAGITNASTNPVVFDTLLGYPVYVNNDIAAPGANAKTIAFGDFSYYKIRDAMDVQMFRFTDSAYTKLGQVAFLAWCRMGGNLLDTAAVKTYSHSAT